MTNADELKQKIKEGEILLVQEKTSGWIPLIVSVAIVLSAGMKILQSEIYLIVTVLALLYMGFNIWRVVKAQMNVRKLEAKIQEYRDQKVRLEKPAS